MGSSIARRYAAAGDLVVVADLDGDRASEVAKAIVAAGGEASGMHLDITDRPGCDRAIQQVLADHGQLDVLCLHAGGGGSGSAMSVTDDAMDLAYRLNLTGNISLLRGALNHMVERQTGAAIVTISEAGLRGGASGFPYGVMKHAMVGVVRHVAWTFANQGIRCNGICPGFTGHDPARVGEVMQAAVKAGMLDAISAEQESKVMALAPRGGTPEEIAEMYYFVGSPAASFLNGAIIPVDGGWSAG
jgi:NAD(P)-dependent dehydrogenase (short-subunit alcohol dehydrogenase family)